MTAERWQQVESLYYAVLEREASRRASFLSQACAGDEELRQEVESLLAAHERASGFLAAPALEVEAQWMAAEQSGSFVERQLSHYRILSQLGAGGMGEIYLALDTQLDRKVALKLLPAHFTQDEDRLRRFVREAKAASALNHPNIIVIHEIGREIGETGVTHYIAAEFVDGQTLRQRIKQSQMSLPEALVVATQTASALVAAHAAGIVHRDIKPENIMIRADGLIKVLDFGLAKLTEPQAPAVDAHAPTMTEVSTRAGVIMGSPPYMSPEQARGLKVDARTDIFSLGVVIYEMIAGRAPFEGATPSDIIAAILQTEPAPLARSLPGAPAEMSRIVKKALRKDRDERYQVVKDLQLDLQSFKEESEFEARLAGAHQPEPRGRATDEISDWQARAETAHGAVSRTGEIAAARATERMESPPDPIKRRGALIALAALVLIVAGLAFAWRQWIGPRRQAAPFQALKIDRLTHTGKATRAAISPDGKYVAYAKDEAGQQSLWLIQVATTSDEQVVPPAKVNYRGITFSHDGNFIYYVRDEQNASTGTLYQKPVLGGAARKLRGNVDSPITLSHDGRLAFVRRNGSSGEDALVIADGDGAKEKNLAIRKHPDMFRFGGPAWSPDGKIIACGNENYTGGPYENVVGVSVASGAERPITSQRWEVVEQVAWLSNGRGLIVAAAEQLGPLVQIWHLSDPADPGNEARKVTNDLSRYVSLSLTADSSSLATVQIERQVNIWVAPGGDAGRAKQITTGMGREDGDRGLDWTSDGKIVYRSFVGGHYNIWIMTADGAENRRLSANARQNLDPSVSPDGHYIVWSADRTGVRNIWRMEMDGGNQTQLTSGGGEWFPQYSPDGKWLIYQARGSGSSDLLLWKTPAGGGAPVQLTNKPSYLPVISPDGKSIACTQRSEVDGQIKIAVVPFEGGPPQLFDHPVLSDRTRPIRWTPDGRALAYIVTSGGVSNLWSKPLAGGPPKPLTDFKDQLIFNFAWSRDGKQLALSRGVFNGDVVLITDLRPD